MGFVTINTSSSSNTMCFLAFICCRDRTLSNAYSISKKKIYGNELMTYPIDKSITWPVEVDCHIHDIFGMSDGYDYLEYKWRFLGPLIIVIVYLNKIS